MNRIESKFRKLKKSGKKAFITFLTAGDPSLKITKELVVSFEKAGDFKTFYSRHTWVRFAREDATSDDWKKAIRAHSLADLRSSICYYRVYPESLERES